MDKRILKGIFIFIAIVVAVFSIYIYVYYATHPHYFLAVEGKYDAPIVNNLKLEELEDNNSMLFIPNQEEVEQLIYYVDPEIEEPILECENIGEFQEKNYINVLKARIFWKECYIYNLPHNEPYLKKANKFVYYVTKYQGFIFLLYVLIYYLDMKYVKKKNYLKDVINKINTEGDS